VTSALENSVAAPGMNQPLSVECVADGLKIGADIFIKYHPKLNKSGRLPPRTESEKDIAIFAFCTCG